MKGGLEHIPTQSDLQRAYEMLLHAQPRPASSAELALFSQWARFDPRFAEIWVSQLLERWKAINPIDLREALLRQPWPATAAVLLEFVEHAMVEAEARRLFRLWKRLVTADFPRGNDEQFFIGQRRMAGKAMFDDVRFALDEYRKRGYLAREVLFNKQMLPAKAASMARKKYERVRTHTIAPATRAQILKAILERSSRICTDEYWNAVGKTISRRQAERDLEDSPLVRAVGNTKGRYYVKRHTRKV